MKPYLIATTIAVLATFGLVSYIAAAPAPESSQTEQLKRFPVEINQPSGPPAVATGKFDAHGVELQVSCSTCHTTRFPNADRRSGDELKLFHQGLQLKHGSLACVACHNPGNYETLRLADGKSVDFTNVMSLCAQCHGPQYRDYQNGSHGGMTGHWDLSKGPRARNNCVDCHDAHYPAYQGMEPVPGPIDRFLTPAHEADETHEVER